MQPNIIPPPPKIITNVVNGLPLEINSSRIYSNLDIGIRS